MRRIVILGAGTAGTIAANRLRRLYAREVAGGDLEITVIDPDPGHLYQPGLLFLPFGQGSPERLVRPRRDQLHPDVRFTYGTAERVLLEERRVLLTDARTIDYEALVIASGVRLAPEETEGLTGVGWRERMFDFYTLPGALALRDRLATWEGGRLVIDVVDMPIKCPVAPLEFAFLADAFFTHRGMRDGVSITYVTPLDGAFTKPVASAALSHLLAEKGIELVTEFSAGRVDGERGVLASWDEREVPFDLLVTIPLHVGAEFVSRTTGLGNDMGFVRTDPHTLQSLASPNVFAIGDATDVPASKAGSVAHFESEVLAENVRRFLAGQPLQADFDGHANCFIETGHDKALLIDFNYDVEPLPGVFPLPRFGPLPLLRQSRLNHLGKRAFEWVYWHLLLPGRDLPGIRARLDLRGKRRPPTPVSPTSTSTGVEEPVGSIP